MLRKLSFSVCLALAPLAARAQPAPLSQQARTFVDQFWSKWSSPNAVALPYISSTVGSGIDFYGKPLTRDAYVKTETDFANRWPERQYKIQPGSEAINCAQAICTVHGIVTWRDFSPDRKTLSAGSAKFAFTLQAQTIDGQTLFLLTSTTGAVIERAVSHGAGVLPQDAQNSASYRGPGDLVPGAVAYYGLRAYSAQAAASGTAKAVQLRRASDDSVRDIGLLKSGALDTAAAARFCAATVCYVVKWFDQTGNGNDLTQDDPARQPVLVLNAYGAMPAVQFNAAQMTFLTGSFPWVSGNGAWSGQAVLLNVKMTRWFEPVFEYGQPNDGNALYGEVHTGNADQFTTSIYGTEVVSGVTSRAPAALTFYSTGAQLGGYVNGFNWGEPFDQSNIAGNAFNLGGSPAQVGIWLTGGIGEVILYGKGLSAAEAGQLATNERAYFGFVNAGPSGPDQTVERMDHAIERTALAVPAAAASPAPYRIYRRP